MDAERIFQLILSKSSAKIKDLIVFDISDLRQAVELVAASGSEVGNPTTLPAEASPPVGRVRPSPHGFERAPLGAVRVVDGQGRPEAVANRLRVAAAAWRKTRTGRQLGYEFRVRVVGDNVTIERIV